jgi:hypothetical protein
MRNADVVLHHHPIFILYYLFYVHHREKSSNHFTPVTVIVFIYHIILALCIRSCILRASYLFCVGSSNPLCVIYLMPA